MSNTQTKLAGTQAEGIVSPRFATGEARLIAGLRGHFTLPTWSGIPAQWHRLASYGPVPGQVGDVHYGLCFPLSHGVDYLSGVEVSTRDGLPAEFSCAVIPAQTYAVFVHRDHVSKLRDTLDWIGQEWLPTSGFAPAEEVEGAPAFFERYGPRFDPLSGWGDVEVWIPIQPEQDRERSAA